jgi:hypothetical protein
VDPQTWLAIACQRIGQHRMLLEPQAFSSDPEFQGVAGRARQVCAQRQRQGSRASRVDPGGWVAALKQRAAGVVRGLPTLR